MPVIDHGQHGSTAKESATHRYGCWNRNVFFDPLVLQVPKVAADGWMYSVEARYPHRMSHACRYDRSEYDFACKDCQYVGEGARYIAEQEAKGAK